MKFLAALSFLGDPVASTIFTLLFIICFSAHANHPDSNCMAWFKAGKVKSDAKFCRLDCVALTVGMNTFMCPPQCDLLCKGTVGNARLGKLIYYPGLTRAERKLVENYPEDAFIAFVQKTRAEWSSDRNFPEQDLNDEGDAFRHFMWAGLLTKELGSDRTKEFLDAHEANPLQPESERNMDQFNNEKGAVSAQNLISNKQWSLENLEKSGLDSLKSKSLKVINPRLKIPEVPK